MRNIHFKVQEDFSLFFGKPSDQFEKNWPSIAPKIVRLAEVKAKRDPLIKEILNEHQQNLKPGIHSFTCYSLCLHKSIPILFE